MTGMSPQLAAVVQRDQCRPDEKCIGCRMEMGDLHDFHCSMRRDAMRPPNYCGCCGNETHGSDDLWCGRCATHVGIVGDLANRTHFARYGEPCPFTEAPSNARGGESDG